MVPVSLIAQFGIKNHRICDVLYARSATAFAPQHGLLIGYFHSDFDAKSDHLVLILINVNARAAHT